MSGGRKLRDWLQAVSDCGVLRVGFDCELLLLAWDSNLVSATPVAENDDALDFRLTDTGRRVLAA
jgi:hypothetical protein